MHTKIQVVNNIFLHLNVSVVILSCTTYIQLGVFRSIVPASDAVVYVAYHGQRVGKHYPTGTEHCFRVSGMTVELVEQNSGSKCHSL